MWTAPSILLSGASGGAVSGSGSAQTSAMRHATRRLHETTSLGQARLGVPLEPCIVLAINIWKLLMVPAALSHYY